MCKNSSLAQIQNKDKNEFKHTNEFILLTKKTSAKSRFIELFIHLNSKLMNWKSSLIEQDCEIKCRICESNIPAKELVLHSYICSQKQEWKKKIKHQNELVKKLITKNEKLLLNLHQKDLDLNITSSPVNDAYFSNTVHLADNWESYLLSPLLSNIEVKNC
jgi:hypothetical protein